MAPTPAAIEVPLGGRMAVPAMAELSPAPMVYGICVTCHGPSAPLHRTCWSCRVVGRQLPSPTPPVVPIFLFALGSPVHRALVGYKAGVAPTGRTARAEALGGVLRGFLATHATCLLGCASGAIVVPVPSSVGGRQSWGGRHPLGALCEAAVAQVPGLVAAEVLRPGLRPPRRLEPALHGYEVLSGSIVPGSTAIIVDDMFVSGARALSAAAALTACGAHVAAVAPLGRLVRPGHNGATQAFFTARSLHGFDPDRCVRCSSRSRPTQVVAWPVRTTSVRESVAA